MPRPLGVVLTIGECPQNARGIYKKGDEGAYRRLECVRNDKRFPNPAFSVRGGDIRRSSKGMEAQKEAVRCRDALASFRRGSIGAGRCRFFRKGEDTARTAGRGHERRRVALVL